VDLVTLGEAMVRFTPPSDTPVQDAKAFNAFVGGSELNVAVTATRLGIASRWVSRLPDNALGHMIANRAREQGVDVRVEWVAEARAGLYFVEHGSTPRASSVLYDRAGSAFSQVRPGTIDWASLFAGARWYHVSGITPALSAAAATVTAESLVSAKELGLTVSYDLNYRAKLWTPQQARATHEPLLEHVDVLNTTEEDAKLVFGIGGDPEEAARALQQRFDIGAVTVTVRDKLRAAVVAAEGKTHTADRFEVETVDRVGAGDAFTGGLIVSRLEQRGWDEALRFATATAALKHTILGDFCLVTRSQVEQMLSGAGSRVSR
jgi:2-dehydro-3-deoxygluconokinase